uniref:Uncharacterized protein n=1 Tax=Anguilla anguilla TaxID=7936 RepID=A0A0E9PQF7_ANGAN
MACKLQTKTSVCHYPRMLHWALGQTVVVKVWFMNSYIKHALTPASLAKMNLSL